MDSIFKRLQAACEDTSGGVAVNESYSGRGMFGRSCIGIVGSRGECEALIAQVVSDLTNELFEAAVNAVGDEQTDAVYELRDTVLDQQRTLLDSASDSMGYDVIIYWPSLVAEAEEEEEDDQLTD